RLIAPSPSPRPSSPRLSFPPSPLLFSGFPIYDSTHGNQKFKELEEGSRETRSHGPADRDVESERGFADGSDPMYTYVRPGAERLIQSAHRAMALRKGRLRGGRAHWHKQRGAGWLLVFYFGRQEFNRDSGRRFRSASASGGIRSADARRTRPHGLLAR